MTDEEKKAIEILGEFKKNGFHLLNLRYESRVSTTKHIENSIETILNLIEKQSKEIEELKEENEKYKNPPFFDEDKYTENDKIKAKIEEIDRKIEFEQNEKVIIYLHKQKRVLQSLLEKE